MALAFELNDNDDLILVDSDDPQNELARVVYRLTRPFGGGDKIVIVREVPGKHPEEITFQTNDAGVLENHLEDLKEFLRSKFPSEK